MKQGNYVEFSSSPKIIAKVSFGNKGKKRRIWSSKIQSESWAERTLAVSPGRTVWAWKNKLEMIGLNWNLWKSCGSHPDSSPCASQGFSHPSLKVALCFYSVAIFLSCHLCAVTFRKTMELPVLRCNSLMCPSSISVMETVVSHWLFLLLAAKAVGPQRGQSGIHSHGRHIYGTSRGLPGLFYPQLARRFIGSHV